MKGKNNKDSVAAEYALGALSNIVNEKTHEPITLLDGRNGGTLREWLKNNKNIKVVTRDRASAYAKVISEEFQPSIS